jgi:HD-like signal output (HDOD) protein
MNALQRDSSKQAVDDLLARSIIDIGIPPCPSILDRFMSESQKDDPDYNRLAHIIGADVSLSASLIKTANSPYFGTRQRVRSANEALAVLGLNTASRAVAGIILRRTFPHVPNLERFWDASARIARLSGWLAQQFELGIRPEDAYTFGLFRDCGIPVLLAKFPVYPSVLAAANQDAVRSFTDIEDAALPTNHAMVGCLLAQSWWLPEEICLAIRSHHDLVALESDKSSLPIISRKLVAASQLAEHIVQQQLGLSRTQEWLKLGQACLNVLGMSEEFLEAMYLEATPIAAADE